jgi:hypothetical protein
MGATTNVTTVLYGTTWDDSTLLEEVKQANLVMEKLDGIKRHFRYDWQDVARYNPDYLAYVENERRRLGEDHPLFRTQYCLQAVTGSAGFLNGQQKAQLQGDHARLHTRESGKVYVAGIDVGGEAVGVGTAGQGSECDATVVTIAELDFSGVSELQAQPAIRIVEHIWRTGALHAELHSQLVDIIKRVWGCRKVVVDATGIGQPVASLLKHALGSRVEPLVFTAQSKSRLGFELLAAVNGGRLKMYAPDNSEEFKEFWNEMDRADARYRPNQTMSFFVDPARGHDDFLMSLALVVKAASTYEPREARGL